MSLKPIAWLWLCVVAGFVVIADADVACDDASGSCSPQQNTTSKPNVLILLADNLGFGDLGTYGSGGEMRGMPTPRIDRLASQGLTLTHFLVEPGCTPSRAALLTGRYSVRSGLNSIIVAGSPNTLQADEITLAEMFRGEGYVTGILGKWHLGQDNQSIPSNQGFDSYRVGILETTDGTLYAPSMRRHGIGEAMISKAQPHIYESKHGTTELQKVREYTLEYRRYVEKDIATAAVEFIQEQALGPKPFFLYVGWSHAHYPGLAHPDFVGKSSAGPYGDMIMEHDHRVGEVLDALDQTAASENTVVIYLSDNGPAQYQTNNEDFLGSSPGPFRGEIGDVLDGSLRVPAIIRWPGRVPVRRSNEMVSIHDFFPTLASLLGAALPSDRPIDGSDQLAFFTGSKGVSSRQHLISFVGGEIAAVRWRNWRIYPKQISHSAGPIATHGLGAHRMEGLGFPALYNIERDPRETWNQVGFEAWVLSPYMQIVKDYLKTLEQFPNPKTFSMTDFEGW